MNENARKDLQELGSARGKSSIHCLTIIGQIEGHQTLPDEAKSGITCSYLVLFVLGGSTMWPSIWPMMVRHWMVPC